MKDALTFGSRKKHLSLPLIEVFSTKVVSDIKMVYTLFCTSKKSCEDLNFKSWLGEKTKINKTQIFTTGAWNLQNNP